MVSLKTIKPNFTRVTIDTLTLWFSYETIIAFQVAGTRTARANDWGPTTGKHLNELCEDKKLRLSSADFEAKLSEVLPSA